MRAASGLLLEVPGGFWRRSAAWSIDAGLCALPVLLVGWPLSRAALDAVRADYLALVALAARRLLDALLSGASPLEIAPRWLADASLQAASMALQDALWSMAWPLLLGVFTVSALYRVLLESSARGATFGQRVLDLRVADRDGAPVSAPRALLRHVAGIASWLTLNLGHALALLPPARRALHDRLAGTQVLQPRDAAPLPGWAWAWLGLLLLAQAWGVFALTWATRASMQSALDAAYTASVPLGVSSGVASGTAQTSRHMKYITPNITT